MNKQIIADVVATKLITGVSQRSGKNYYRFQGVIVGCLELPLLAGVSFDKFISEEVYKELSTLQQDRFDCSIGLSRSIINGRDMNGVNFDMAFNLYINGFPKEEEPESTSDNVSQITLPDGQAVDDKSKKGGK